MKRWGDSRDIWIPVLIMLAVVLATVAFTAAGIR